MQYRCNSLHPKLGVAKKVCIMTNMHHDEMHYEKFNCTLGVWGRLSSLAWMVELPCPRKRHHHLAFTLHLCPSQYPQVGSLPHGSLLLRLG